MLLTALLLLCVTSSFSAPLRPYLRTASAIIYEEDGIWGSVVLEQYSKRSPVLVKAKFKNIDQGDKIEYEIRSESVHYDDFAKDKICSDGALKGVLTNSTSRIGELIRFGMKPTSSREFSARVYHEGISLFGGEGNVIGRSFVLRRGKKGFACGTILVVGRDTMPEGYIPCVKKSYERCLVGSADPNLCVYRRCEGHERYWGVIDHTTTFCRVVEEVYPKLYGQRRRRGMVGCRLGRHGLLIPVGRI